MADAQSFHILNSVDSTNNYAMSRVRDGVATHGETWFTYEQTAGKGRRGKRWHAEKGKNVMMSIAVNTGFLALSQQFYISMCAALACLKVLQQYAGEDMTIKWPNDILWNDRKAGGILIENVVKGKWQWSVIGIGLNINQTVFEAGGEFMPVSLKQITGKDTDVIETAKMIRRELIRNVERLKTTQTDQMLKEYNQHLFSLDKKIRLRKNNAVFETTLKGVSAAGRLLTMDTMEREFEFDEVNWVRS